MELLEEKEENVIYTDLLPYGVSIDFGGKIYRGTNEQLLTIKEPA